VWHEADRVIHGRKALDLRAAELQAESPGWVFRPAGPVSVNDDLGHLGFHFGRPTNHRSSPALTSLAAPTG